MDLLTREFIIWWLNPTPHATAVYASCSASRPPHATLASRRLATALPGPDLHRLIAPALLGAFPHSITSSAMASSFDGISRPSALAVLSDDLRCRSSPAARAGICRRHPHQCWHRQRLTIQKAAFLAPDWGSRSRAAHCRKPGGLPVRD